MFPDAEFPPLEDVLASRGDSPLQALHDAEEARRQLLAEAARCPTCGREPKELEWFWFESPPNTWTALCGRAGWMTFCSDDRRPVDFFLSIMN